MNYNFRNISEEEYNKSTGIKIFYSICCVLMIIFAVLLIIVYLKEKYVNSNNNSADLMKLYNSYFNIFFCAIIILNNTIRLIPDSLTTETQEEGNDDSSFLCYFQAFSVSLFDKLLISLMTIYSINNYLSVFKSEFYKNNLKRNYIILITIGFLFSLVLTIIYISDGLSPKDVLCYIHTRTIVKKVTDNIYISILFITNLFCLINLILNLSKLKEKYKNNGNEKLFKKSSHFLFRFILDLGITFTAFIYIYLLINKAFPRGSHKDLAYLLICLIVELFFTYNEFLFKAFIRLITCNKYYKLDSQQNSDNENDDDGEIDNNEYFEEN